MNSKPYNPCTAYFDLSKCVTTSSSDVNNNMRQNFQKTASHQNEFLKRCSPDHLQINPISPCESSGLDNRHIVMDTYGWDIDERSNRSRGVSNSSEESDISMKALKFSDISDANIEAASGNLEVAGQPSLSSANCNLSEMAQLVQQMVHQEIRSSRYRLGCVFCKKNGETYEYYSTHVLKDNRGKIVCPILRRYKCPTCQATGDGAHTQRHCPLLNSRNLQVLCPAGTLNNSAYN